MKLWIPCTLSMMLGLAGCGAAGDPTHAAAPKNPVAAPAEAAAKPAPVEPVAPPQAPVTVTVPAGQAIPVRTIHSLSTKTARNGQAFSAVLTAPLTAADGTVLAPRGATANGVVVTSDPGGRVKGVARLSVRLTGIELTGGKPAGIATSVLTRRAPATKKKDALKIGAGSGAGAVIGAIAGGGVGAAIGAGAGAGAGTGAVLLTRGAPAVIPSETLLTFALSRPLVVSR
ncbi:MAG: hypothetical protein IT162_16565 [Bryobacterales bacterium]|nr:hypothetical protein [Bryobacterales bacterium]